MENFVCKGQLFLQYRSQWPPVYSQWIFWSAQRGFARGAFPVLPEAYRDLPLLDFGDRLILPGLVDLHLHGPQFAYRGLGMDLELLDWLKHPHLPGGSQVPGPGLRRACLPAVCGGLAGAASPPGPPSLPPPTQMPPCFSWTCWRKADSSPGWAGSAWTGTALNICGSRGRRRRWRKPGAGWRLSRDVTAGPVPFSPPLCPHLLRSLLEGLGRLARETGLPVQSHLSENQKRKSLWCRNAFQRPAAMPRFTTGLGSLDTGCIMAHCVHSREAELALLKERGVFIAHSPESNSNLASGVAPVRRFLEQGLRVGLASDVAGGSSLNLFRAMAHAIQASKLRWQLLDQSLPPLPSTRSSGWPPWAAAASSALGNLSPRATPLTPWSWTTAAIPPSCSPLASSSGWSGWPIWQRRAALRQSSYPGTAYR